MPGQRDIAHPGHVASPFRAMFASTVHSQDTGSKPGATFGGMLVVFPEVRVRQVLIYSVLLIVGLVLSQVWPGLATDPSTRSAIAKCIELVTYTCLGFIMIHVGQEFELDKTRLKSYGVDFVVALSAAVLPWLLCTAYFVLVIIPSTQWGNAEVWKESLVASVFSAPTSAGVLFSMLAAAGLGATWIFKKARVLAIFDDLDVVLLMIPLKALMVGPKWQLGVVILVMAALLALAYKKLHAWQLPASWKAVTSYAVGIVLASELLHVLSAKLDPAVPIHIEVLLPAFVLGCVMARAEHAIEGESHGHLDPVEHRASTVISGVFLFLVGLSMPLLTNAALGPDAKHLALRDHTPVMSWGTIAIHVVIITIISNLGKMVPALCYRAEAKWNERLALAIGMWPRGEVGAGVLVLSLGYGISGPIITIALLSLAANLVLTGGFIVVINRLLAVNVVPSKS